MGELLEFRSDGGDVVLVEVDQAARGEVTRGGRPGAAVIEAGKSLDQVVGQLGPVIKGIVSELRSTAGWPDEVEVEFAVKMSADSNLIIARAAGEANFRIKVRWSDRGDRP